jgi:uncharacterized LabA/DUF88 family protein
MAKRGVILVDGSNLYMSARRFDIKVWPPDIRSLIHPELRGEFEPIIPVHFFTSVDRKNASQQRFLNHIAKSDVIVHDYDLKIYTQTETCPECDKICARCGRDIRIKPHKEKMLDIAIATKMIELAYLKEPMPIDTFIIVSGDKDLIPAIRLLRKTLGKEVVVAGFRHDDPTKNSLAYEMNKEVNYIINLTKLLGL